ncbi:hypothetical protein VNO78_25797 [Psophocarpus tetragonolobus]|uniref:Uncharacterized protein n=1 Tax=Psophocarpus tetragonolobus TaxID=3891 RepID=A0AAN9S6J6_PSOTE
MEKDPTTINVLTTPLAHGHKLPCLVMTQALEAMLLDLGGLELCHCLHPLHFANRSLRGVTNGPNMQKQAG